MCWASRSGGRTTRIEFLVIDLGFQGCFSAGLDTNLSFFLSTISSFYIGDHAVV
jgi:hypothetical protein